MLAGRLHCLHVDTGTHYRALTHLLQARGIPYTDIPAVERALGGWRLDSEVHSNHSVIRVNRVRIEDIHLRSALVNAEVSQYSALAPVRSFLLPFQRAQAAFALQQDFRGLVMEGRDIGLNIFPDTPFKYFLFADQKVKMARRARQGITDVIEMRDRIDSTQGQLRQAPGATLVDTTHSSLDEVVDWISHDIQLKLTATA